MGRAGSRATGMINHASARICTFAVFAILALASSDPLGAADATTAASVSPDLQLLLVQITQIEGQSVSIDNSSIWIMTPAIRRISDRGRSMIPDLLSLMDQPVLSFDAFCRCYGAINVIVHAENPGVQLPWYGGARLDEQMRLQPSGQVHPLAFRTEITLKVREIISGLDAGSIPPEKSATSAFTPPP